MAKELLSFSEFETPSREQIESAIAAGLKGTTPESLDWKVSEDVILKPYYRRPSGKEVKKRNAFLAGQQAAMWLIRQDFTPQPAKESNEAIQLALANGVNAIGISVQKMGGAELNQLLDGVQLEHISCSIAATNSEEITTFLDWLKNQKSQKLVAGSIELDPFAQLFTEPTTDVLLILENIAAIARDLDTDLAIKTHHVDAAFYRNAGASIFLETAIALATGSDYLAAELNPAQAKNIHFSFAVGSSYFLEIARLRAFRVLWHNLLKAYDTTGSAFIHCMPSSVNTSSLGSKNNLLRSTSEAMSAIIGGCDSLSISAHNKLVTDLDPAGLRYARNIQLVLQEEAYLSKVRNVSGGSHYIEALTDKIIEETWKQFLRIEKQGGIQKSIESGHVKNWIEKNKQEQQEQFAAGTKVLVGVNLHRDDKDHTITNNNSKLVDPSPIQFRLAEEMEATMLKPAQP